MKLFVALPLASFVPGAHAEGIRKEEAVQRTMLFAGTGPRTLEVGTIFGNIKVDAYDGADGILTAKRLTSADSSSDFEAAQRDVVLDVTDGASTIKAYVRYIDGETCGEKTHRHHREWPDYEV